MLPPPWATEAGDLVAHLGSDAGRGLDPAEAVRRRERHGPNVLVEEPPPGPWVLFAHQFANTMTVVLSVAAAVTLAVGDVSDTVVIVVIVVLNALIGFFQEYRAEQAVQALRAMTAGTCRVVRDGVASVVPVADLVPGDIVELAAGDVVAADLRLVEVGGLRIDEAALTGESEPVAKDVATMPAGPEPMVGDLRNMAFKGTAVVSGHARGLVVATGMGTRIGRIATLLRAGGDDGTPLQRRLAVMGRVLAAAAIAVCAVVFIAGIARGEDAHEMFLTAVSLAVAAIPEGLPAVVTVSLAFGARRMAERHALVRRLSAVETLGSVTVICTDKTGTLTQNRMVVEAVWTPDTGAHSVTGEGYEPVGAVSGDPAGDRSALRRLALVAAACNDAAIHPPDPDHADWWITGDPTEGALVALAAKAGVDKSGLDAERPREAEVPFDAERRRMTTVHRHDGGWWAATKGSLSSVSPLLADGQRAAVAAATDAADRFADQGYRVLALAEGTAARNPTATDDPVALADAVEVGLRLTGLVAIADPPRPEAAASILACRTAGITPVMITGDHPRTARAISSRLGLLDDGDTQVFNGEHLATIPDDELDERIGDIRVFARTDPEQKLRIVDAWRRRGDIVAMTGDGVNDAPALRRADIGVAMGVTGTDVSKEAADMVLADDDFATIVRAVQEGRRIYDSIRRFVRYLLCTNSGEIWVMFLATLAGLPLPLLPIQILWVNLVTDGLPAMALGLEPAHEGTMRRPPRPPRESILAGGVWQQALWVGLLMAAVVLPLQAVVRDADGPWRTMGFTTLAFLQLGHALAARSETRSLFGLPRHSNPWVGRAVLASAAGLLATVYVPFLQRAFDTEPLAPAELSVAVLLGSTVFVAVEAEKWWRRARSRGPVAPGPG